MKVVVNGKEKKLRAGATLKTAIAGEPYVKGSLIAVHLSEEKAARAVIVHAACTDCFCRAQSASCR